ncbi:lignin peroxidase [Irpex rosettiformis]|uniref:Lignin peroxidase n=1 Tax=Irpex rosettiformis TaxID=378272 RepID=A0ACB8UH08_9APHY|nr:lignin peroxidase [Irpex rosettiformis]
MGFQKLIAFATLITAVVAAPAPQANCGGGRFVRNAACCAWFPVLDDIQANLFSGSLCAEEAHEALRLTFHDAVGFSIAAQRAGKFGGGGADGSILAFSDIETSFAANFGLDFTTEAFIPFALAHGVSFGDFVQFAGAVGVSNCIGGPRLQFLAGRSNISRASPDNLVPEPTDSSEKIFERMQDIGFSPIEVVHLLTAHTVSAQYEVDTDVAGSPFDSTPSTFDNQFFVESLLKGTAFTGNGEGGEVTSPIPGEFRLQSDFAISRDSRTACEWQSLVTNHASMVSKFETVMAKLATVGQDPNRLIDCSDVIPVPPAAKVQTGSFPPGKSKADVQSACAATPFPNLATLPGPVTSVLPVTA